MVDLSVIHSVDGAAAALPARAALVLLFRLFLLPRVLVTAEVVVMTLCRGVMFARARVFLIILAFVRVSLGDPNIVLKPVLLLVQLSVVSVTITIVMMIVTGIQ